MTKEKELSFEEAIESLETIVTELEKGDIPLEKAIAYYQEGMDLSKKCSDQLKEVHEKMTKIMDEQGKSEPFEIQEDE